MSSEPTWDDVAAWYDAFIRGGSGPHETATECLLGLVRDLAGAEVLDVGCGQGLATRALADAGAARVVGLDSSAEMLEHARGQTVHHAVEYVLDDAQDLASVPDATFDGVTSQLVLMSVDDLDSALAAVRRVLRPGGWFAFVIGHPCFLAPDAAPTTLAGGRPAMAVTGYFDERFWRSSDPEGVRRVGNHHRTISTYLNALTAAGFVLETVDEPRPAPRLAADRPVHAEVPIMFAARARALRR